MNNKATGTKGTHWNPNSELVQVNKCSSGDVNAAFAKPVAVVRACARWAFKDLNVRPSQGARLKVEASAGLI